VSGNGDAPHGPAAFPDSPPATYEVTFLVDGRANTEVVAADGYERRDDVKGRTLYTFFLGDLPVATFHDVRGIALLVDRDEAELASGGTTA
jgi:hypothetical protein